MELTQKDRCIRVKAAITIIKRGWTSRELGYFKTGAVCLVGALYVAAHPRIVAQSGDDDSMDAYDDFHDEGIYTDRVVTRVVKTMWPTRKPSGAADFNDSPSTTAAKVLNRLLKGTGFTRGQLARAIRQSPRRIDVKTRHPD